MSKFKLVQVRTDGQVNESEFSGYCAETAMIRFRTDAQNDARSVAIFVFHEDDTGNFYPYSSWTAETTEAK